MRWNENKNLLAWIIIIIAIIPASDDWYLAKIFVLLWILTGLFQMFRPRLQSAETDAILHYLLLSYSLWAILDYLFPVLHPILMILIWLLLFIYILFHWIGSPRKSVLVPLLLDHKALCNSIFPYACSLLAPAALWFNPLYRLSLCALLVELADLEPDGCDSVISR